MVRHYTRKKAPVYTREDIQNAVRAVREEKMKLLTASKKFNVPRSTLHDHLKKPGLKVGSGHPTVFSESEEKHIVAALQALQEIGFGLTRDLASVVIHDYLADQPDRVNPFKKGTPGPDWWSLFMSRWTKELSLRKPRHLPTQQRKREEQLKKRAEKKEEQQKKKEEQQKKKEEQQRKKEEQQRKKEEQQRKKEEQQRKKEEQQRKREEQEVKQVQQKKEGTMRKRAVSITKVARRKSHSHYKRKSSLTRSKSTTPSNNEECCQECGLYVNDDEDMWIGCDNCTNWYHYTCLGLSHIPKDDIWLCLYCE